MIKLIATVALIATMVQANDSKILSCIEQGLIQVESGGNKLAVNKHSHAIGLYQFTPITLIDLGIVKKGTTKHNIENESQWIQYSYNFFINSKDAQHEALMRLFKINKKRLRGKVARNDLYGALALAHHDGAYGATRNMDKDNDVVNLYYGLGQTCEEFVMSDFYTGHE